jgi:hypothetical protein
MQNTNDPLEKFLKLIETTNDEELGCDEVFKFLDEFAEVALKGDIPKDFLPMVRHHLEICRDCCEEHEALLRILQSELSPPD